MRPRKVLLRGLLGAAHVSPGDLLVWREAPWPVGSISSFHNPVNNTDIADGRHVSTDAGSRSQHSRDALSFIKSLLRSSVLWF